MIASQNKDVKFLVLMAGLEVSGIELSLAQNQFAFNKASLSDKEKDSLNEILKKVFTSTDNWTEYVGSRS